MRRQLILSLLFFFPTFALRAEALPNLETLCLSGRKAQLPQEIQGRCAILVFGFSKASKEATSPWEKRLEADFGSDSRCAFYLLADLSGAPGFIRGFIKSAMRSGTSAALQERFLILEKDSELWKTTAAYSVKGPDEAYLLELDPKGQIVARFHGAFNESNYLPSQNAFKELLAHLKP